MTHHHVNIKGNDSSRHAMTQHNKQLCKTMTHGQDLCNVTIKIANQDNNSKNSPKSIITQYCFTFNVVPVQAQHKASIIQNCWQTLSAPDYKFNSILYFINRYSIALYEAGPKNRRTHHSSLQITQNLEFASAKLHSPSQPIPSVK